MISPTTRKPTNRGISMTFATNGRRRRLLGGVGLAGVLALGAAVAPAFAETAPSDQLSVNLLRLLVKQGVVSQSSADELLAEAERQTAAGRAAVPMATAPPVAPGVTRIPYVPEVVKNQIRDEIRQEVMAQARSENWAQPEQIPEWTRRVSISGDLRMRDQFEVYSKSNIGPSIGQPGEGLIDFAALNANGPTDINYITNPGGLPFINTRKDRYNQLSLRARLAFQAEVSDQITAKVRIATGQNNTPVSTSQIMGGGLTKKQLWLDQAYVEVRPQPWIGGAVGRMPNPFFTTDLLYDPDLNFDGGTARARIGLLPDHGVTLTGIYGAFLLDYQDGNFPANSPNKMGVKTKWMFGGQGYVEWANDRFDWRVGAAFYQFQYDRGLLSEPCYLYTGVRECSTDFTRPAFMQKGNTLFLIRNVVPDPSLAEGLAPNPQYAGLLFDYDILNLTTEFDLKLSARRSLVLSADYVRNTAYRYRDACRYGQSGLPVNNVITVAGSDDTNVCATRPAGTPAPRFRSGPNAFMLRASYGDRAPEKLGQWSLAGGYKHIAADSMIDAYTDSDFHLGGTNAKGYFITATVGVLNGANIQARWLSAKEVSGPPLSIDVGQIDLNVKF